MLSSKIEHGQFFTVGNCFKHTPFIEWLSLAGNPLKALEPFAGAKNIPNLLPQISFDCFDIEPAAEGVIQRDTIANFPIGYDVVITNPPYLARNSATSKGLNVADWNQDDLYKISLDRMLANSPFVAAIIPESFITSTYPKDRLHSVISITYKMFDDTDCPVCLAMFVPESTNDYLIYQNDEFLGSYQDLKRYELKGPFKNKYRMTDPKGILGVSAVDSTSGPTIEFCRGDVFAEETIKESSRFFTRITVMDSKGRDLITEKNLASVISELNYFVDKYRMDTKDVFMTSTKGLRKDGKYRRRLSWAEVKALIEKVVYEHETTSNPSL